MGSSTSETDSSVGIAVGYSQIGDEGRIRVLEHEHDEC
jgi:hypothetical protein